jgi:hypothetical protein
MAMSSSATLSPGKTYEALQAAVVAAEERLRDEQRAQQVSVRALASAEEELHEQIASAVERGEELDAAELDRLTAAARGAGQNVQVRFWSGARGEVEPRLTDVHAAARVQGAERRLENAREELRAFVRGNLHELVRERVAGESAAAGAMVAAAEAAAAKAIRVWERERSWWSHMLAVCDRSEAMGSEPAPPFPGFQASPPDALTSGPCPRALL